MWRTVIVAATAGIVTLAAAGPLAAHDFWIEPDAFQPDVDTAKASGPWVSTTVPSRPAISSIACS